MPENKAMTILACSQEILAILVSYTSPGVAFYQDITHKRKEAV